MAKAQAAVFFVNIKNHNLNAFTDLGKFSGVLYLFAPRKVADMNQAVNTFF